jgi:hypothetical protein
MMSKNINVIVLALLASLLGATAAWASDVYIDQAGSTTTINITQIGADNTVGSSGTPSTIVGDNTKVDITQTGTLNTADIAMGATGTSDSTVNYTALGGSNILDVQIDGATDTTLTTTIVGDNNEVTLCGTIGTVAAASQTATCATGVQANTTTSNIAITGDRNQIAIGADAASAVNNITVGGNVTSSDNVINLSQTGLDVPNVTLNVDGSTNAINITQQ